MRTLWNWLVSRWENVYNPSLEQGSMIISREHLYDVNAAASRNWWYDKRGNRWPLKDSL